MATGHLSMVPPMGIVHSSGPGIRSPNHEILRHSPGLHNRASLGLTLVATRSRRWLRGRCCGRDLDSGA